MHLTRWHAVALTGLLLTGCLRMPTTPDLSACQQPVPAPTYTDADRWDWATPSGDEIREAFGWLDNDDVYFAYQIRGEQTEEGFISNQAREKTIISTDRMVITLTHPLDFPLAPGKRWTVDQNAYPRNGGRMYDTTHERVVLSCETVDTPAGTFAALHIRDTLLNEGGTLVTDLWYAPAAKTVVKQEAVEGTPQRAYGDPLPRVLTSYSVR